jgi:hypothetical protein
MDMYMFIYILYRIMSCYTMPSTVSLQPVPLAALVDAFFSWTGPFTASPATVSWPSKGIFRRAHRIWVKGALGIVHLTN